MTGFLEWALLERKGDVLKLKSDTSFAAQSITKGVGFLVGPQENKNCSKGFSEQIRSQMRRWKCQIAQKNLSQQSLAKSDIQMRLLNAGRRLCVYNTSRSTWEFFGAIFCCLLRVSFLTDFSGSFAGIKAAGFSSGSKHLGWSVPGKPEELRYLPCSRCTGADSPAPLCSLENPSYSLSEINLPTLLSQLPKGTETRLKIYLVQ